MNDESEVSHVVREAFEALQPSHPELIAKLTAAIESARKQAGHLALVESAFREAAKSLVASDRDAAQVLFRAAETLGEISSYWSSPRDS